MNKFIKLILGLILVPVLLQAQVTGDQLTGLGVESTLASRIASIGNSSTTRLRAGAGTALLPSYSFFSDTDTGLYSSAANTIGVSGSLALNDSTAEIKSTSIDGADNKITNLCGGGDDSNSRGSYITLSGNESGPAGNALISAGNVAGAYVQIAAPNATGFNRFDVAGAEVWRMNAAGGLVGAGTGTIGWAVVDGTDNTACSSQCVTPAVFGFNLAGGATAPVIVSGSDATADICLCAGAS